MLVKCHTIGFIDTNCYVVVCKKTLAAIVIDPGFRKDEGEEILREIFEQDLQVRYIVNTHGHADHTSGNSMLKQATGAEILVHENDAWMLPKPWKAFSKILELEKVPPCLECGKEVIPHLEILENKGKAVVSTDCCGIVLELVASPPADRLLNHGDVIKFGKLEMRVIHTPGHSKGSISLYCESDSVVFTGDTLYADSIGGTDLPESSHQDIMKSLNELMNLPEHTIVYPAHGEKTTIGKEKRENPFLRT
ncbi:MAG: MBL fold metallo-hydrolase [Candidatus Methanofastidiosia archaeon]